MKALLNLQVVPVETIGGGQVSVVAPAVSLTSCDNNSCDVDVELVR